MGRGMVPAAGDSKGTPILPQTARQCVAVGQGAPACWPVHSCTEAARLSQTVRILGDIAVQQEKKSAGSPSWVPSEHNAAEAIPQPHHKVTLHDLTIRDGEESADLAFTTADKLKIADALARLGITRTEVFLTVPGWHEVVRGIMSANLGLDLWVTWMRGKVEKALDLGVRHVMIWHGAGEGPQKYIARQSRPELIDQLAAKIDAAKAAGCKINVFMPELTRADLAHLLDVARMAEAHGADAITVVDSQGVMRPAAMTYLVSQVKQATKLEVEVHCHNDFGLAVANVLAGYEGGADILQVSINGIGYRAGNASMESVAMALEVLYGVPTGLASTRSPKSAPWSRASAASRRTTTSRSSARAPSATSNGWRSPPTAQRACGPGPSRSSRNWSVASRNWSSASGATRGR